MDRVRTSPPMHARIAAPVTLITASATVVGIAVATVAAPWIAVAAAAATAGGGAAYALNAARERAEIEQVRAIEAHRAAYERESAKYRALLEGAADMVVVLDAASGAVLECNARARDELGDVGDLAERMSGEDARTLRETIARSADDAHRVQALSEIGLRSATGHVLDCDARLAAVELADRRVVHVALRDRTHERAIERELALRERLASLGLLTAGVAHEINNPLEGIGNHVKLLGRPDLAPEDRARHLDMVRHGFERVRDLVRDLLRFARPAPANGEVDLAAVVERARRLAAYSEGFRALQVVESGLDRPLRVLGDAGRLEQVVFNLLLNASKAMKGRGRIEIGAQRAGGARGIVLTIADDGPGIPPEHLERVFDPFFTTGGGTGLGLSIAFGILQAHGGSLAARNRAEGGAEFTLRFPDPTAARAGEAA